MIGKLKLTKTSVEFVAVAAEEAMPEFKFEAEMEGEAGGTVEELRDWFCVLAMA